jgi:hypothetical protein
MQNQPWHGLAGAILLAAVLTAACTSTGGGSPEPGSGSVASGPDGSGATAVHTPAGSGTADFTGTPSSADAVTTSTAGTSSADHIEDSSAASAPATGPHVVVTLRAQGANPSATDLSRSADLLRDRIKSIPGATVTAVPPRHLRLEAPGTDVTVFDDLIRRGVLTLRPVVTTWPQPTSTPSTTSGATGHESPDSSAADPSGFPPGSDPEVPTQPSADTPAGWQTWESAAKRYASGATAPSCGQLDRYQDLDDPNKPLLACDIDGGNGYLLDPSVLAGNAISAATATQGTNGVTSWVVTITFSVNAQRAWSTYTGEHIGEQVSLTLDGQVLSAPQIVQQINGGSMQINANFTQTEATDLAKWLGTGALPLAFRIDSRTVVH